MGLFYASEVMILIQMSRTTNSSILWTPFTN